MIDSTLLQNASVLDVERGTLVPDQAVLIEGIASPRWDRLCRYVLHRRERRVSDAEVLSMVPGHRRQHLERWPERRPAR